MKITIKWLYTHTYTHIHTHTHKYVYIYQQSTSTCSGPLFAIFEHKKLVMAIDYNPIE